MTISPKWLLVALALVAAGNPATAGAELGPSPAALEAFATSAGVPGCDSDFGFSVDSAPALDFESPGLFLGGEAQKPLACIPAAKCCKICKKGKACGDSCIAASSNCSKGRGCACDSSEVC